MHQILDPDPDQTIAVAFSRFWAAGLVVLVATSWKLWFSPDGSDYPSIPLLPVGTTFFDGLQSFGFISSITVVTCSVYLLFFPRNDSPWILVGIGLLLCFVSDQHRIQPWAYQSFFYSFIFGVLPARKWHFWILPFAASIYAYSAAGKFDSQFFHTVGNDFVTVIANTFDLDLGDSNSTIRNLLIALLPSTELLVALGLCFRRTRVQACLMAMVMHLTLFIMLGPWAKNHSLGVLIWNLMLVVQNFYLIRCFGFQRLTSATEFAASEIVESKTAQHWCVLSLWMIALISPCLERFGYWDHWTSWSLYSPHTSRARIEFHQSIISRLSESQQKSLEPDIDGDQWQELNLGVWSLGQRGVPVYPQARYQLEIAYQVAKNIGLDDEIRVKLQSVSDRKTGVRKEERYLNVKEIAEAREQFWLRPK